MRLRRALFVLPAAAAALLLVAPTAAMADESVQVKLLPLNHSGATGTAILTAMDNGDLKVSIRSSGLVPNEPHPQHLHGSTMGMDFHCPDMSADTNHNGYVSTEEGMPIYGDIFISLTTSGDVSPASGLAVDRFPKADAKGNLSYDRTIPAADLPPGTIAHLKDLHIVQHGIDANGNHKYDMAGLGESTLAVAAGIHGIPEEATDPALCGMVAGAAVGSVPVGGVATGDGSTRHDSTVWFGIGGLALLAALGLLVVARRRDFVLPRTER
jgi:LPXTG-motif cell wall-anchored protein